MRRAVSSGNGRVYVKKANLALWIVSLASLGVAAASLSLWTMRTPPGDQRELVLRDEDGKARIRLVAQKTGARIDVLDENQRVRLSLGHDATGTSVRVNRAAADSKGVELLVRDGAAGPASQATVAIYSSNAEEVATLAVGTEASLLLSSAQGGHIQLSQATTKSEINALNASNWVKLGVGVEAGIFSTKKALSVELLGGYSLTDYSQRPGGQPTSEK
jgi:hypothetical protein